MRFINGAAKTDGRADAGTDGAAQCVPSCC
jgi:hypothetical protein